MTPLESTYKQCVGRQNVGAPQNSAVLMSPMFGRKSEDHTNIYLYHQQFTLLYYITNNLYWYHQQFTLLYYIANNLFYFTTFP